LEVRTEKWSITSQFLLLTSALLLLGHFLPWAAHPTSALTRSAHELAVMTNFTPGAGIFLNEWFLLPLWSAALLLVLACASAPLLFRSLAGMLALVIASLGFPTYPQVLTAYANPDYRLQFFITLTVMAAIVAATIAGSRVAHFRPYIALACAAASAVPLVGYLAIKPFIEDLYRGGVGIGLGWWITLVAVVTVFAASGAKIFTSLGLKHPRA
jgi:hypothetical protein